MSAPAADLELRITTEDVAGGTRLHYDLHSPAGSVRHTRHGIEGPKISVPLQQFQARMMAAVQGLNHGLSPDGAQFLNNDIQHELEAMGRELYEELFPEDLQRAYWGLRGEVKKLLIVSDEPWIPWELVKPHEKGGREDDFLCCQFELTRWLAGRTAPAQGLGEVELGAASVACIEAGNVEPFPKLPYAVEESRLLAELAKRHSGVESLTIADAAYNQVEEILRLGGHGIIHFIGHGEFDADDPNISRFYLTDNRSLRPRDLQTPGIESRIRQDRPLVFFNSCQVAQLGYSLSRLGGWVSSWILDCGCGAFIGPYWNVRDASAHLFAEAFYTGLEEGKTVGRAALDARLKVRKEAPASTAWLAFAVYAHPSARLRLGLGPVPLRIPQSQWRPKISPPGALLRAEYGIVPFHGRDRDLEDLLSWSRHEDAVRIRLYTGAGGMGKTRLALEVCRKLRQQDWQTGFVEPDPARSPLEMWRDLQARGKPSLLVVDYAETRRDLLVPLLREMNRDQDGYKIRMLMLARAALDWWEQLKNEGEGVGELLSGPATRWFTLTPLAETVGDRLASYRKAAQAFSIQLQRPAAAAVPGGLDEEHYERVLLLHIKALADIEGVPVKDEDGILDFILHRERRYWARLAVERNLSKNLADHIGRAMALITLGGGVRSEDHAVTAIHALRCFNDQDRSLLTQVARLLHESYPGGRWIEPILPDLLGEHLIMREMEKGANELLDIVLGPQSKDEKPAGAVE